MQANGGIAEQAGKLQQEMQLMDIDLGNTSNIMIVREDGQIIYSTDMSSGMVSYNLMEENQFINTNRYIVPMKMEFLSWLYLSGQMIMELGISLRRFMKVNWLKVLRRYLPILYI